MMRKSISTFAVLALAFGGLMLAPAPASAQTGTGTAGIAEQLAGLLAQIQELRAKIQELQQQQNAAASELRETVRLTRTLARGMSGEDVRELQELLASDPELYPEGLVTGFFGPLTQRAMERLQERFGIEAGGSVDAATLQILNRLFVLGNRGHGNVFDRVIFDPEDDDDVDTSAFTPGTVGIKVCHAPAGNVAAAHTIAIGGPAVRVHLAHGDTLGECDDDDADDDEDENEDEDEDEDEDDEETAEEEAADDIADAEAAIAAAREAIEAADEDDRDVSDAEELLEDAEDKLAEAEEAFDDEEWEEAEELAEEAEDLADDAKDMAEDLMDEDDD